MENKEYEVYKDYMRNIENVYKCNTCPENHNMKNGYVKPCGEKQCIIIALCI